MIDKKISDFLDNINEANFHKSTKIKYYGNTKTEYLEDVYKAVNFDEKLNMFRLISGERYEYDKEEYRKYLQYSHPLLSKFQSYYFNSTAFLPLIEALKNNGNVVIETEGVSVFEERYNRPGDKQLVQKGIINGNLRLYGYVFSEYNLHFIPQGVKMESWSSIEVITARHIIRVSNPIANKIYEEMYNKGKYTFDFGQLENEKTPLYYYVASTPDSDMSYARIKELICVGDVNKKIFALGFIFPIVASVLNKAQIDELSDIIEPYTCADDFDTRTVASVANDALKIIEKYPVSNMIEEIKKQHPELGFGESTVGYGKTIPIEDHTWILEQESYSTSFPISALEALIEDALANPGRQITVTTKGHYHYIRDRSDDFAGVYDVKGKEDKDINIKLVLVISKGTPNFSYSVISEIKK